MPEIIRPEAIQDDKPYYDIAYVILSSVEQLMELAETLEIPVAFQTSRKRFMFIYNGMRFMAKQ